MSKRRVLIYLEFHPLLQSLFVISKLVTSVTLFPKNIRQPENFQGPVRDARSVLLFKKLQQVFPLSRA